MRKELRMILLVVFVIPGIMLAASCTKKEIRTSPVISSEPPVYEESPLTRHEAPTTTSERDMMAREHAIEDERLRQERLRMEEKERLERLRREGERIGGEVAASPYPYTQVASGGSPIWEDIYFPYDSAALSPDAQDMLRQKAEWLRNNPSVSLIVEGHCDERGTNAYNMALGDRRAESVKAFLANLGVPRSRMTTISYGEEQPSVLGSDEAVWRRNRRVHFVLE